MINTYTIKESDRKAIRAKSKCDLKPNGTCFFNKFQIIINWWKWLLLIFEQKHNSLVRVTNKVRRLFSQCIQIKLHSMYCPENDVEKLWS